MLALRGVRIGSITARRPWLESTFQNASDDMSRAFNHIFDPNGDLCTWKVPKTKEYTIHTHRHQGLQQHYSTHRLATSTSGFRPSSDAAACFPCCGDPVFELTTGSLRLCPSGAAAGGVMVILYGGLVPYTLRPCPNASGSYVLVGECYADGNMHGEGVSSVDVEAREEVFWIL